MSCWRIWPSVVLVCCSLLLTQAQGQQYSDEITHPVEVMALKTIRKSLDDSILKNLSNWGHGDPCTSNWTGVLCYNSTMKDGYLHVEELQLLGMKLSGNLSPGLGHLTHMRRLNFMWNNISGSIPKEIGNITSLELLLLNGNQITGSLPEEIGYLPHLDRIQIDQNQISGQLPSSFANLNKTKHFHMNNNSISGPIPPELSRLPNLVHLLLDNNNLSGSLPSELSKLPNLLILQLDNNNFGGSGIPASYGDMSKLLKLSLRNCNLHGRIPDLSRIPHLAYLDLSSNQLNGSIPPEKLSMDITTIDLSENNLTGTIPTNFSDFPSLQRLSLSGNSLSGTIPSTIWHNWTSDGKNSLSVFLQNNMLSNFSGSLNLPPNVTVWLQGNPICSNANIIQFCGSPNQEQNVVQSSTNYSNNCLAQECPPPYEYASESSVPCFCAAPLLVGYRLKSPGFWDFLPYFRPFEDYLTSGLSLDLDQLSIPSFVWEEGPRLKIYLKIFPEYNVSNSNNSHAFNKSEVQRITSMFTGWNIPDSNTFGPYELLNLTLLDLYKDDISISSKSGVSKGALAGIVVGAILGAVALSAVVSLLIVRTHLKGSHAVSKRRLMSRLLLKIGGLREFTYGELELATNNFNVSSQIGQGGYGKVYKGILADGTAVAIKRAQEGSLQGQKEFLTEIELLSRLHHRNLVSLIGYCDEEGEQMLIYEFMSNGSLRDHLSGKSKEPLSFAMRLRIALASAKGILYLHTEADPPIFHRDIKATNILLDSKFTAKVADFGLSRLAPVPEIDGHVPAHVSTVVKGTPGYLDPEYFLTHKLTDKSDVYSLGVVFLELLTGMQPISHGKNIVREVNVAYHSGIILSIIDKGMGSYPSECMEKFLNLALKCCQDETDVRPFMIEVVRELENICLVVPEADNTTKSMQDSTLSSGKDKEGTTQSSPSTMRNPYLSSDISGSDLVSGTFPTIVPR